MRSNQLILLSLAALVAGCSNIRDQFRPRVSDAPFVFDIGVLTPIDYAGLVAAQEDITGVPESVYFGRLGAGENPGVFGGATFQFMGTGGDVCIVVDPESIFWNQEISTQSTTVKYKYKDIYQDDGDIDLAVGLSAYYTGSPGKEIGDFEAVYTDPSGIDHELEFNECVQVGYFGDPAHAGRATVEYCEIDTSLRPGVMYTAVLETFALPIDDSILNYGVIVYDGPCQDKTAPDGSPIPGVPWTNEDGGISTGPTECAVPNEVQNADPDGELPEDKWWVPDLEAAICGGKGKVNTWCKDNPGEGCQELDDAIVE